MDPLQKPASEELFARAAAVKLIVFDVDGVLTDGGLYYGPSGESLKRFDVKDGHALVMARLVGLPAAVLTARRSSIVEIRMKELGFAAVAQGKKDKAVGIRELLEQLETLPEACAYMGDDVNDLCALRLVGLPSCPADAATEVRRQSLFIAQSPGGKGAARELVELCLKASGRWNRALDLMQGGQI